jgi:hypothetical protein
MKFYNGKWVDIAAMLLTHIQGVLSQAVTYPQPSFPLGNARVVFQLVHDASILILSIHQSSIILPFNTT